MAATQEVTTVTLPASGDLSAHQFKFGTVNAAGQVALTTTLGGRIDGIIASKPTAAGQATELQVDGIAKVISSGVIAAGAEVSSTALGLAITSIATYYVFGVHVGTAAAAASDIIPVLIDKYKI